METGDVIGGWEVLQWNHSISSYGHRICKVVCIGCGEVYIRQCSSVLRQRQRQGGCPACVARRRCRATAGRVLNGRKLYATCKRGRSTRYLAECACGVSVIADIKSLETRRCQRCFGTLGGRSRTQSRFYRCVVNVLRRCTDRSNDHFADYGGRGIYVHAEWVVDRLAFIDYIAALPGSDNAAYSLDRINPDGNYVPGNLRWASKLVQALNQRHILPYLDQQKFAELIAKETG